MAKPHWNIMLSSLGQSLWQTKISLITSGSTEVLFSYCFWHTVPGLTINMNDPVGKIRMLVPESNDHTQNCIKDCSKTHSKQ